jgi:hypothetical protein
MCWQKKGVWSSDICPLIQHPGAEGWPWKVPQIVPGLSPAITDTHGPTPSLCQQWAPEKLLSVHQKRFDLEFLFLNERYIHEHILKTMDFPRSFDFKKLWYAL